MRLQELSLRMEVIGGIKFFSKRLLDKMSLGEVIVSRLSFLVGLFLDEVKIVSTFPPSYTKWALALFFMALRLHCSKSLSVFFCY